jgi:bifunctional non-homologous end joining protein LigD
MPGTRSADWLKMKNWKESDTVILGYRLQPRFGLIVGLHFPTVDNKSVATVEYGMSPDERAAFLAVVKQIHTVKDKHAQWVEPVLCCRVQYLERTDNYNLHMVSLKGFVPGKNPAECGWAG